MIETKIDSESDLLKAMKILTLMGPKIVVVTSSSFSEFPGQIICNINSNYIFICPKNIEIFSTHTTIENYIHNIS